MPLVVREEGLELVVAVPALLQLGDGELLPLREGRPHLDQLVALRSFELEGRGVFQGGHISKVQGWSKRRGLGCAIPRRKGEFTQPGTHLFTISVHTWPRPVNLTSG